MKNYALVPAETQGASLGGTLVIEQFLMANYRFRRNILNGKVEFAVLPKADNKAEGNTVETIGSLSIAKVFGRLPGITSEQLNYLTIWLRSSVAPWLQMDMLHGNECVPTFIGNQGCGKTMNALGYESKSHSNIPFYQVAPLKKSA